jgi:hypothetical protein
LLQTSLQEGGVMVRFMCIVAHDRPELCDYLMQHFAEDDSVKVTLDRRHGERRRQAADADEERRQEHRRWLPNNQELLSSVGCFMVPVERESIFARI